MTTNRYPGQDIDEDLQSAGPRRSGRVVPMAEPIRIDIIVNGVVFGVVDPTTLKARAQIDLERVTGALGLLKWCETYAGVSADELAGLESELAEMPLMAIVDLAQSISAALGEAMTIPKVRGRR